MRVFLWCLFLLLLFDVLVLMSWWSRKIANLNRHWHLPKSVQEPRFCLSPSADLRASCEATYHFVGLLRNPQLRGTLVHFSDREVLQRSLEMWFRKGKAAQRESFLDGISRRRLGGYPGGRPDPQIFTPSLGAQENKVFHADVLDPKARKNFTQENFGLLFRSLVVHIRIRAGCRFPYSRRSSVQTCEMLVLIPVDFPLQIPGYMVSFCLFAAQPEVAPKQVWWFSLESPRPMNTKRVETAACKPLESRTSVGPTEFLGSAWSGKSIALRDFRLALGLVALTIVMPATERKKCGEFLASEGCLICIALFLSSRRLGLPTLSRRNSSATIQRQMRSLAPAWPGHRKAIAQKYFSESCYSGESNRPLTPILLKSIAIRLPCLSPMLLQKCALFLAESRTYTNLHHATARICIAMLLQKY